jgi:hypothetical protein
MQVIASELFELSRHTHCEKRQDWSKGFDFDEAAKMAEFWGWCLVFILKG